MSSQQSILEEQLFLQAPPGKRYVRSFLFSRRIDAPLARLHLAGRVILIMGLSAAQLRTINTAQPDLAGAIVLWVGALILYLMSGMNARIARLYFLLMVPALFSLFLTWIIFNPLPGKVLLLQWPIYAGHIDIGITLWEVTWLAIVGGYFWWKRQLLPAILIATVIVIALASFFSLPGWIFGRLTFFHPLVFTLSDQGLLLAVTKVVGYSGTILATIALVVTCRDAELIGTMRQFRLPQPIIFFASTVCRALELAMTDYDTIREAQIARAIGARPRSLIRRVRDLGNIAVPMVAMMIRRSSEIGDALQARGYSLTGANADFYETTPWRLLDWLVLALSLALLYVALAPHPNLTTILQRQL